MSDEENTNDTIDTSDEVTQDTSEESTQNEGTADEQTSSEEESDETPSEPTSTITYCTVEDVVDLFGDNVSDTIETNLIDGAIKRASSRIHNKLRARGVPLPDVEGYSSVINAIATYYAACDCYGALYNGDDYQTQSGHWCNEARELLEDYCDAYWNTCAEDDDKGAHSLVKHSNAPTYAQKRGRRGVRRWVR